MNKIKLIILSLMLIISVALNLIIWKSWKSEKTLKRKNDLLATRIQMLAIEKLERGYAQGQLDATKDTIRIQMINDSTCVWISSPWGKIKPFQDTIKNLNVLHK